MDHDMKAIGKCVFKPVVRYRIPMIISPRIPKKVNSFYEGFSSMDC
jgi:hypothetical protein